MLSIKVIGYYDHYNAGDEQYKISFHEIFKQFLQVEYTLEFHDCDKIKNTEFSDEDIIILGGGDILNDYFLDKIHERFGHTAHFIFAISVGLPYTGILVDTDKLDIIDYIFLRTPVDIELFKRFFNDERIFYLPDISYVLTKYIQNTHSSQRSGYVGANSNGDGGGDGVINYLKRLNAYKEVDKKVAIFCLSRHIYSKQYIKEYKHIIANLTLFMVYLVDLGYHLVFLPFNTNNNNNFENDIIIHRDLISNLLSSTKITMTDITFIEETLDFKDIFSILKLCDICFPMRFHACLFSIYNKVPFIPIYTTRKVKNLIRETQWCYSYELPTNRSGIPTDLNVNDLIDLFIDLKKPKSTTNSKNNLLHINMNRFGKKFVEGILRFIDKLLEPKEKIRTVNNIDKLIDDTYSIVQTFIYSRGYSYLTEITDDSLQDIVASIVTYNLTGGSVSDLYNYGLKEKMFKGDYNYKREWRWIVNHFYNLKLAKTVVVADPVHKGLFNMEYIDQNDYSGSHRSGWQYVYENLFSLQSANSDLLLDLYIDRTFHWNLEANKVLGIVPYTKDWIGFVHHTFDTSFSDYNNVNLLSCPEFIESLRYCKGLFVLSDHLKMQFEIEFAKRNICVNVHSLIHPTDTHVQRFSYDRFYDNPDKKLVHVGGWLRNLYSFYSLQLPDTTIFKRYRWSSFKLFPRKKSGQIKKQTLKGKHMNNYFPENNFLDKLKAICLTKCKKDTPHKNCCENCKNCSKNCCGGGNCSGNGNDTQITNNWYKHFYEYNKDILNMEVLEYISNEDYDKMMTENLVFVNLVDASAVNTVIECVVRETPIVVNKHPAVIEVLGENYPLYYTDITQIKDLLKDSSKIYKAHRHLANIDKSVYRIEYFIESFIHKLFTKKV